MNNSVSSGRCGEGRTPRNIRAESEWQAITQYWLMTSVCLLCFIFVGRADCYKCMWASWMNLFIRHQGLPGLSGPTGEKVRLIQWSVIIRESGGQWERASFTERLIIWWNDSLSKDERTCEPVCPQGSDGARGEPGRSVSHQIQLIITKSNKSSVSLLWLCSPWMFCVRKRPLTVLFKSHRVQVFQERKGIR